MSEMVYAFESGRRFGKQHGDTVEAGLIRDTFPDYSEAEITEFLRGVGEGANDTE